MVRVWTERVTCGTDLYPKLAILLVFRYTYPANPAVKGKTLVSRLVSCVNGTLGTPPWWQQQQHQCHRPETAWHRNRDRGTDRQTEEKRIPTSRRRARSPRVTPPSPTDSPASSGATLSHRLHPCIQIYLRVRAVLVGGTSDLLRTRMGV